MADTSNAVVNEKIFFFIGGSGKILTTSKQPALSGLCTMDTSDAAGQL